MKKPIGILIFVAALVLIPAAAIAFSIPPYEYATPVFGLAAAPDNSLLVADDGSGIVELRKGEGNLVAPLPGVAEIAPIGRGAMFAVTGAGEGEGPDDYARKLFRVSRGSVREIADLGAFEEEFDPDEAGADSNPFDVAALTGGQALVADAGGNSVLIVDQQGNVDWVATLPIAMASTAHAKMLVGCPTPPPGLEFVCSLPDEFPAQAVATSVVVGKDGAYYVGELKGFPAPPGTSRIWRIEPGTLNAECGTSPACTVVFDGFTSIVDLTVGSNGELIVTEMDEATWLAAELEAFFGLPGLMVGGTVNSCDVHTATCTEVAGGLPIPIATAIDKEGTLYAAIKSLIPGEAEVIMLP